jgi:hypothetical protein
MRHDYGQGVISGAKKNLDSSEMAARDEFNRRHPPTKGLVVEEDLRKMDLPARPWRKNKGHYFDLAGYEVLGAHMKQGKARPWRFGCRAGVFCGKSGTTLPPACECLRRTPTTRESRDRATAERLGAGPGPARGEQGWLERTPAPLSSRR